MLTPGFVTDAFGILLILPFTRPVARRLLTQVINRRLLPGRKCDTPRTRIRRIRGPGRSHGGLGALQVS